MHFFCFQSCFENLSIAVTLEPLVWFRWRFQQKHTSTNEDFNLIENWKCDMLDFRLIPLDRITNGSTCNAIHMCHQKWTKMTDCFAFELFIQFYGKYTHVLNMCSIIMYITLKLMKIFITSMLPYNNKRTQVTLAPLCLFQLYHYIIMSR